MLLLGRGSFSSKGKSLIKLTKTRIDVIKRKRGATQKFLKKDIADLLANGLDQNAFGRAEGLISELILSSCYDFIYHVCDIILKHLSAMQKQRDCPEDCKEAVASLMFAAARFSDLPELRDLRDIFQGRYGTSLEHKVNKKFVEHISAPNPPTKEQKMQLLQDIASEFTLRWDSLAFEQRMTNNIPAAREGHYQPKAHAPLYRNPTDHLAPQVAEPKDNTNRLANKMEVNPPMKLREALHKVEHHKPTGSTGSSRVQDEMNQNFCNGQEIRPNRQRSLHSPETENMKEKHDVLHMRREYVVDAYSVNPESRHPKRQEPMNKEKLGDRVDVDTRRGAQERVQHSILSPRDVKLSPEKGGNFGDSVRYDDNYEENVMIRPRKLPGKDKTEYKSSLLPPPYVKPKSRKDRIKQHEFHRNGENNGTSSYDRSRSRQRHNAPAGNDDTVPQDVTELYYEDDDVLDDPNLRRKSKSRSRSRRHVRSCSSSDNGEEVRVVRRVSTTRRRNESSKQGLQILFDEDHGDGLRHHRGNNSVDEEEKMIEKLLMHYSKKDKSAGVSGTELESRRRDRDEVSVDGSSKSSRSRTPVYVSDDEDEELHLQQKHPARSVSLPKEQIAMASTPETKKVFTRAVSFDQGPSTPAKHVHPKLPDYDDLAARFAALRRS